MEHELFTFVACTDLGHVVESRICTRKHADHHFDEMIEHTDGVKFVAYYCGSVGGLINSWYLA